MPGFPRITRHRGGGVGGRGGICGPGRRILTVLVEPVCAGLCNSIKFQSGQLRRSESNGNTCRGAGSLSPTPAYEDTEAKEVTTTPSIATFGHLAYRRRRREAKLRTEYERIWQPPTYYTHDARNFIHQTSPEISSTLKALHDVRKARRSPCHACLSRPRCLWPPNKIHAGNKHNDVGTQ